MMANTRQVSPADVSLFHIASQEYGDATAWLALATANGLKDPFIAGQLTLVLPVYSPAISGGAALQSAS
jgi:hypothetical protein